jgi:hypothetical protein
LVVTCITDVLDFRKSMAGELSAPCSKERPDPSSYDVFKTEKSAWPVFFYELEYFVRHLGMGFWSIL